MGEEGLTHGASQVDRAQCHKCLAPDLTYTRIKNLGLPGQIGKSQGTYKQGRCVDASRPIRHSFNKRAVSIPSLVHVTF